MHKCVVFLLLILHVEVTNSKIEYSCGQHHGREKRIIGGVPAAEYHWPWQVFLHATRRNQCHVHHIYCGGTIIGKRWILTSAHCKTNPYTYVLNVAVGVYNTSKSKNNFALFESDIEEFIIHPGYKAKIIENDKENPLKWRRDGKGIDDIALIKLKKPLSFTDNIQPICLPSNDDSLVDGKAQATIIGWGNKYTLEEIEKNNIVHPFSSILQQANITIKFAAKDPFVLTVIGRFLADRAFFPLRAWNGTASNGDSGGPVMIRSESTGRWFQHGLVALEFPRVGPNELFHERTNIFVRVSKYCNFIQETTDSEVRCEDPT